MEYRNKTIAWINGAKFMAILGVLVDHTTMILYTNQVYHWGSYFAVSLFILISGMLTYRSIGHHNYSYGRTVVHSLRKILIAYLIATFIYQVWAFKTFDFTRYITGLIAFNTSGPFYYVLLYIHLMLVSKILYTFVAFKTRPAFIKDATIGYCIIGISYVTTNYSNIMNVYGGGGKLLGGTYLFLFYLGMIFEKYHLFKNITLPKSIASMIVGGVMYLLCLNFAYSDQLRFDIFTRFGGVNPPGISFISLALCMICWCYGFFNVVNRIKHLSFVVRFVSWLGSHTLYIFLFHRFWLDYILCPYVAISNIYLKNVVYYGVMIGGSIFIEVSLGCMAKLYRNVKMDRKIPVTD